MTKIVSLAKRRGFVFPSSEIYGGIGSTWDYGPLGVELKRAVKEAWWRSMVYDRDDIVGLDSAIIQSPEVWIASGHAEGFTDPLVECPTCHKRYREDHLLEALGQPATATDIDLKCPDDGAQLSAPRLFNLMFETHVGPVQDTANKVWLRPETAQGIFINFDNVIVATRKKVPFGIAQIGKSFRNEITPGNFIFRTREFEQMEMEFFVKPGEEDEWYDYWIKTRFQWFLDLGVRAENLRTRPHDESELAHYAKGATDVEYLFPWGWSELEGIASRTDFDLSRHEEHSGKKLQYFDQEENEHYWPYVIEPALGADRAALAILVDAYDEESVGPEGGKEDIRVLLRFHPDIAPVQVAVLPLSRNDKLVPKAKEVHDTLRRLFRTQYDDAQSIGRRYRRQDEIGTPLCVTVDFETVETDDSVTIRNRDTMTQIRVPIADLADQVREQLRGMGSTRV
ncbi:MAG: glycine--tRNA ligase [Chloroflexi bacterium]|nr:glycine--tRNA ligase [Chloroflexota bacterium]